MSKRFAVVFKYIDPCPLYRGLMTWSSFESKEEWEKSERRTKVLSEDREVIVKEGVTEFEAQEMVDGSFDHVQHSTMEIH